MTLRNDDIRSWGVSIAFHAILFLIMLFWYAFPTVVIIPREIEITFIKPEISEPIPVPVIRKVIPQPSPVSKSVASKTTNVSTTQPSAKNIPAKSEAPTLSKTTQTTSGEQITVPPIQPRSQNPVEFTDYSTGNAETHTARSQGSVARSETRESQIPGTTSRQGNTGKENAPGRITNEQGEISGTPSSSANIVWGNGISRHRIAGSLPKFPSGVNREAQIKVKFTVRPDGSLYGISLLQKGEPAFEQAALTAMRSWKFNTLNPGTQQIDQEGTVTFYFKLK